MIDPSDDRVIAVLVVALVLASASPATAQILPPGAMPTRLVTGFSFTEGPLYDGNGGVYFTNLNFGNQNASDIVRYDIAGDMATVVDPNSGGANGLIMNPDGQIVSADQGTHQVSLRSADDVTAVEQVLADEWNGKGFNSPNDLVMDAAGGIYFTDPEYNNVNAQAEGVYYRDPAGTVMQILTGFNHPNGIVLSPDGETLYLAVEQEFRIMAYDVGPDGLPSGEREFAKSNVDADGDPLPGNVPFGPDGMAIDRFGNLYAAVHNAVFAWNPAGERLFSLNVNENPNNVTIGGEDGNTLFIAAGRSLYGIDLNLPTQLDGDYNDDGVVSAADYVVWRNNTSGEFTPADYQVWVDNFGNTADGGTGSADVQVAVPEPAAVPLFFVIGMASLLSRRRPLADLRPPLDN